MEMYLEVEFSIAPIFAKVSNNENYLVTDNSMTRFNITLKQSVEMVLWAIQNMEGFQKFLHITLLI